MKNKAPFKRINPTTKNPEYYCDKCEGYLERKEFYNCSVENVHRACKYHTRSAQNESRAQKLDEAKRMGVEVEFNLARKLKNAERNKNTALTGSTSPVCKYRTEDIKNLLDKHAVVDQLGNRSVTHVYITGTNVPHPRDDVLINRMDMRRPVSFSDNPAECNYRIMSSTQSKREDRDFMEMISSQRQPLYQAQDPAPVQVLSSTNNPRPRDISYPPANFYREQVSGYAGPVQTVPGSSYAIENTNATASFLLKENRMPSIPVQYRYQTNAPVYPPHPVPQQRDMHQQPRTSPSFPPLVWVHQDMFGQNSHNPPPGLKKPLPRPPLETLNVPESRNEQEQSNSAPPEYPVYKLDPSNFKSKEIADLYGLCLSYALSGGDVSSIRKLLIKTMVENSSKRIRKKIAKSARSESKTLFSSEKGDVEIESLSEKKKKNRRKHSTKNRRDIQTTETLVN